MVPWKDPEELTGVGAAVSALKHTSAECATLMDRLCFTCHEREGTQSDQHELNMGFVVLADIY